MEPGARLRRVSQTSVDQSSASWQPSQKGKPQLHRSQKNKLFAQKKVWLFQVLRWGLGKGTI